MDFLHPKDMASSFYNHRWNNFFTSIKTKPVYLKNFAKWLCDNWKQKKYISEKEIFEISLYEVTTTYNPDNPYAPNVDSDPYKLIKFNCVNNEVISEWNIQPKNWKIRK